MSEILKQLNSARDEARRNNDRETLRVVVYAISQVQHETSRPNIEVSDRLVDRVLREIVSANMDLLEVGKANSVESSKELNDRLVQENEIIEGFLLKVLTEEDIKVALAEIVEEIKTKPQGQAIKSAMMHLEENGHAVLRKDVATVVRDMLPEENRRKQRQGKAGLPQQEIKKALEAIADQIKEVDRPTSMKLALQHLDEKGIDATRAKVAAVVNRMRR